MISYLNKYYTTVKSQNAKAKEQCKLHQCSLTTKKIHFQCQKRMGAGDSVLPPSFGSFFRGGGGLYDILIFCSIGTSLTHSSL